MFISSKFTGLFPSPGSRHQDKSNMDLFKNCRDFDCQVFTGCLFHNSALTVLTLSPAEPCPAPFASPTSRSKGLQGTSLSHHTIRTPKPSHRSRPAIMINQTKADPCYRYAHPSSASVFYKTPQFLSAPCRQILDLFICLCHCSHTD